MPAAMTLINSQTVSSAVSTVTLGSIPAGYRDLYIVAKIAMSGNSSASRLQFNGDTAANYSGVFMDGTGSAAGSGSESAQTGARIIGAAVGPTTGWSVLTLSVLDYSQTDKHKTVLSRWGDAAAEVQATASRWASTSAITSLTIYDVLGQTYSIGSTFYLYGIAG